MKIFIGSSTECKEEMLEVAEWVEEAGHTAIPWTKSSLFSLGEYLLPSVIKISQAVDAAILIFGEDDQVWYRNEFKLQARGNVLIECGLFTGALGAQNTIMRISS